MARVFLIALALGLASSFAPTSWTVSTRVDGVVRRSPTSNRRLRGDALGGLKWPWASKKEGADGEGATDDITNTPLFLKRKLDVLAKEADGLDDDVAAVEAAAAEEVEEWGPQIDRMKAEFDAVKKRTVAARKMAVSVETAGVLDQLLPVTDNFDRALAFRAKGDAESPGAQAIVDRYAGPVAEALDAAFAGLGATKIDEVGVAFDPSIHEAAMAAPDDEVPPDHVTKVFQYGMKVGDRLIRPATVVVSEG